MNALPKPIEQLPVIRNARFLNIGNKTIIAGSIYGHWDCDVADGSTFYSEPVTNDDGEIVVTTQGSFSYVRQH